MHEFISLEWKHLAFGRHNVRFPSYFSGGGILHHDRYRDESNLVANVQRRVDLFILGWVDNLPGRYVLHFGL